MSKRFLNLFGLSVALASSLSAVSMKDAMSEVLHTNPVVQERLKNFRATQQDLNIAESGYMPQLDLRLAAGYNRAGEIKTSGTSDYDHAVTHSDYRNYESSLTFTQNLFNGFGTKYQVDYEKTRIMAAAYKYLEVANDTAYKMVNAYLAVLRTQELVQTARENVDINLGIYEKVQALFDGGLTTDSEVKKIQATLSLARSNLKVKQNNARDAEYQYRRILGRLPEIDKMAKPELNVKMPESIEAAALYAIENNPSMLVSRYNIKGAQSLYQQRKKDFYPTIDLEVSQNFNDYDKANGFDQADDRFRARVILNYNIFRGGADDAVKQQNISRIAQEVEIYRDLKRQVVEDLDLSWNAYEMILDQLQDLKDYSQFSETTLELYKEEYDLGRRTLLDLLSAQNDVISSRNEIIGAEYDQLMARYRILDAMGLLVVTVNGTSDEFTSKVNLSPLKEPEEILDTMPIKLDADDDKIADSHDLCDNSLKENNIMPYGCKKIRKDDDKDGVFNEKDECPFTPLGVKVDKKGCEIKEVIVETEPIPEAEPLPEGYTVDENNNVISVTMRGNFTKDNAELSPELKEKAKEFSNYLKDNPELKAKIVGHASKEPLSKPPYNIALSKKRAASVKQELVNLGIDEKRLLTDGKGYDEPIADNATRAGRELNRRIEVEIIREENAQ